MQQILPRKLLYTEAVSFSCTQKSKENVKAYILESTDTMAYVLAHGEYPLRQQNTVRTPHVQRMAPRAGDTMCHQILLKYSESLVQNPTYRRYITSSFLYT
ncbi:hypothetical protein LOAG_08412 [Loa loa]|uniref:Uncharacterized protein n=1 Tax=Loa loa TaxID=7209 RepID=A0A1I7W3N1_LOALO|nr:hypothetical protein LOAG_08412 [Loa loa]EFO20083.1 hypothetical protein LOAG_08412 [Loa loa]